MKYLTLLILPIAAAALLATKNTYAAGTVFESLNYPGHYLRHQNFQARLHKNDGSNLFNEDASFRIKRGLTGKCNSFESVNYPNHYLRHQGFIVKLHKADGSDLFKKDATFCIKSGLASASGKSFESINYPGHYLRHQGFILKVQRYDRSDLFKKDATFFLGRKLKNPRDTEAPQIPDPAGVVVCPGRPWITKSWWSSSNYPPKYYRWAKPYGEPNNTRTEISAHHYKIWCLNFLPH